MVDLRVMLTLAVLRKQASEAPPPGLTEGLVRDPITGSFLPTDLAAPGATLARGAALGAVPGALVGAAGGGLVGLLATLALQRKGKRTYLKNTLTGAGTGAMAGAAGGAVLGAHTLNSLRGDLARRLGELDYSADPMFPKIKDPGADHPVYMWYDRA